MKKILISSFVLILTVSLIFIQTCGKKQENIIRIGVIGPMTGEGATYGAAMKRGIDLAMENVNNNNGINGKFLKAIYEDSKLKPKDALNGLSKLINFDKVQVVIGAAASSVTLQLVPKAIEAKVILFSSISTADDLKNAGEYFFRNVPPNRVQGETAAKFTVENFRAENAAIFYANDDYGISISKAFEETFKDLNKKIVYSESYTPGSKNFRDQLIQIKNSKPNVVFFPGILPESGIILRQARELDMKSIFIGGDGSYSPQLINIAGKAAENSYYTLMALPPESSSQYSEFKMKYVEKYKKDPDVYSVYAFDAAMVIFKAIEKAKEYKGEKIKDELFKIKYNGVAGIIEFDKFGEVKKDYSIYKVENGDFRLYKQ